MYACRPESQHLRIQHSQSCKLTRPQTQLRTSYIEYHCSLTHWLNAFAWSSDTNDATQNSNWKPSSFGFEDSVCKVKRAFGHLILCREATAWLESNAAFAEEMNSCELDPWCPESVRRWLTGLSAPSLLEQEMRRRGVGDIIRNSMGLPKKSQVGGRPKETFEHSRTHSTTKMQTTPQTLHSHQKY